MTVREQLFALQDLEYQAFNSSLMPTVDPNCVIGVRVPVLRKLAKALLQTADGTAFMQDLPHRYHEENCLHGFLIASIGDFDRCVDELERFLPYVDNWATCDLMSPKVLKQYPKQLLPIAQRWMQSDHPYTIRFGILCMMRGFLEESFQPSYLTLVANLRSGDYYVNMMIAWFFA